MHRDELIRKLNLIQVLLEQVQRVYNSIPSNAQDVLNNFHTEYTSLGHCIRWGTQDTEELLKDLKAKYPSMAEEMKNAGIAL